MTARECPRSPDHDRGPAAADPSGVDAFGDCFGTDVDVLDIAPVTPVLVQPAVGVEHVEQALRWMIDAVLDGEPEHTAALSELSPEVQFLGVQFLRAAARASLSLADVGEHEFLAATSAALRDWMLGDRP